MYKILTILFLLVVVTNPLTAQVVQPEVFRLWDWVIANTGWIFTSAFALYITALAGYLFAKQQLSDEKATNKKVAQAKKSKRNLGGMKYEVVK